MEIYKKLKRQAEKLVEKLENNCTSKTICENYGQKEIGKFLDKKVNCLPYGILDYQEQCEIKDILYKVSLIIPKRRQE